MNRFEYREARTVHEAVEMLRQEEGARIVAGATDFLIRWRQGVWKPRYVLNIKRIPGLDEVNYSSETGLSLGTLVTIRTLERHPLIQEHYPALAQAAAAFAGVQICNLATVGGNVCNASPAGDTLPALLAYGAECRLAGPEGERLVPLEQFCLGPGHTALSLQSCWWPCACHRHYPGTGRSTLSTAPAALWTSPPSALPLSSP